MAKGRSRFVRSELELVLYVVSAKVVLPVFHSTFGKKNKKKNGKKEMNE